MPDDPLAPAPRVPADAGLFTPDLYPGAPRLVPASGHRHSDDACGRGVEILDLDVDPDPAGCVGDRIDRLERH